MRARHTLDDVDERIASLRSARARLPELVRNRFASRHRRAFLGHDGRLLLIRADGADPAPGSHRDRADLLRRLCLALDRAGVDGVIAAADVLEDLLMLEVLEDRVVIGQMHAAGAPVADGRWSRPTGYDAGTLAAAHLEGGALACVVDPPTDANVGACATLVTDLAANGLVALVRPSSPAGGDAWAAQVTAGLGGRSTYTWLVLAADADVPGVAAATTLPIVVDLDARSGDRSGDRGDDTADPVAALAIDGVVGVIAGASVLHPADDDVAAAADRLARQVHPPTAVP